jgi:hypothetical protein
MLTAAALAGLLTLALFGVANSVAGPSDCMSDLTATYCYDNPGPSLTTSLLASAAVATGTAVLRWRKGKRDGRRE